MIHRTLAAFALLACTSAAFAAETQRQFLSGKGNDDGVPWDFMCTAAGGAPLAGSSVMNADKWSTIKVPSNWELQGFGVYTYGRDAYRGAGGWPKITGHYKRTFTTPATWSGSRIFIVFDGSMTDTAVMVNGKSAGATHQGGYYQFKYDITDLLKAGDNLLEVTVDDESANASVNNAERRGDYWNYAGIFRPVYLESVPLVHIERVAIDAKADGTFNVDVILPAMPAQDRPYVIKAQVRDAAGNPVGEPMSKPVSDATTHLSEKVANPKLWNAETPNLYTLEVTIGDHTVNQKFGFRTIETRSAQEPGGPGLFVNGSRIMLKGADRHCFWPTTGRTLSDKISRDDIALLKELNMNAVRCSHYPPDQHFLDDCDELGIYVLDELGGWHAAYDTPTGHRLVGEMLTRDINHPSILFWDNGNEGGWNTALDDDFAKWDPQKRGVIHPQATFRGLDNTHYPQYNAVATKSNGNVPFFPTEMLHGLYDGGGGAGLEDYWKIMTAGRAASGGFIWALVDEDVIRTDKGGILDSKGNQAPDGIVGPYREKEGSFYAIKQVWSPIIVTPPKDASHAFTVENRYSFTNAEQCKFIWETLVYPKPNEIGGKTLVIATRTDQGKSLAPGATAQWAGWGPATPSAEQIAAHGKPDAVSLRVTDPNGKELWTFVWPASQFGEPSVAQDLMQTMVQAPGAAKPSATASDSGIAVTTGDLSLNFDKTTGLLASVSRAGKPFSLINGPKFFAASPTAAAGARNGAPPPAPAATAPGSTLVSLTQKSDGNDLLVTAAFSGIMKSINYRIRPNGWVSIDYAYSLTGTYQCWGVGFQYPEKSVQSMRYLGNGPATVYQNRLAGGTLDVWDKKYNDTMVGDPDKLAPGAQFDYPIFKGYYAGVQWLQLKTAEGAITARIDSPDLFVQVLSPSVPAAGQIGQTGVPFPAPGLGFLHAIPAIGSKFTNATTTGPMGQPAVAQGDYRGAFSLFFGDLKP